MLEKVVHLDIFLHIGHNLLTLFIYIHLCQLIYNFLDTRESVLFIVKPQVYTMRPWS